LPAGPQFFDPRCPASMASAIQACLTAGRQAVAIGEAQLRATLFSWQRTADQTLSFYESLVR